MVKLFQPLYMASCLYLTAASTRGVDFAVQQCNSTKLAAFTIIAVFPFWIRFVQCLRRYYFNRNSVQLWLALKYMLTYLTTIIGALSFLFLFQTKLMFAASTQNFLAPANDWGVYRIAWLVLLVVATT